jgi:hypothetical protein
MTYKNRKARRAFARSTGHQKTAQGGHPAQNIHITRDGACPLGAPYYGGRA